MTQRFHLIGIGGAGMSVVAELLAARGHAVSGSDRADSAVLDHLRSLGVEVFVGHDAAHVPADATVVVSTAVRESNEELAAARARGQRVIHRSQALALAAGDMRFVAVAGAHGKTTTSGMLAVALEEAGLCPSVAVGGVLPQLGSGARIGTGDVFVAEADESDGSFLNYSPWIELVTNVEPDHLDRYASREAFEEVFVEFSDRLEEGGTLVCCAEDPGAARLAVTARAAGRRVVTYGRAEACAALPDVLIDEVEVGAGGVTCRVRWEGREERLALAVTGAHNALNATGAWCVGCLLGVEPGVMARGLAAFVGTARRFEFRGEVAGRRLFDDYAHHPTEVAALLAQARTVAAGGEVAVLFQPHLFSRTLAFADRFAAALSAADTVVLTDVYAAREDPMEGVSSALIADRLPGARLVADMHEAARLLARLTPRGGIALTVGAGSVTTTGDDVLDEWRRTEESE